MRMDEVLQMLARAEVLAHLAPYHPTIAGSGSLSVAQGVLLGCR